MSQLASKGHHGTQMEVLHQNDSKWKLSGAFYPFLVMASCFSLGSMVYNTFITTFVLRATGDSQNVMIFNIILALCQPFAMVLACVIIRKVSAVISQQIGLFLLMAMSIYVFFAVENSIAHIYWIAAIQSIANGFYFTTYAWQFVSYTTNENRDKASGIMSFVANLFSLIFSGGSMLLFKLYPGYAGYRLLFLFATVMSIISVATSLKLAPMDNAGKERRVYYRYAARVLRQNTYARSAMAMVAIDGMRVGVFGFLPSVLLYNIIQEESLIGLNTLISTLAGILAYAVYARVVRLPMRYNSAKIGILTMLVATLLLLVKLSPATILIYSAANAVTVPFYVTPIGNTYWVLLEKLPELGKCRPETHAVRETYYTAGRIAGIVITMLLPNSNIFSILVLFFMVAVQYIGLRLTRKIMTDFDKVED